MNLKSNRGMGLRVMSNYEHFYVLLSKAISGNVWKTLYFVAPAFIFSIL